MIYSASLRFARNIFCYAKKALHLFCHCDTLRQQSRGDLKVKFTINYCTSGSEIVKMIGEFCSWKVDSGYTLKNEGNCNWSYTLENPSASFKYKFIISNGSSTKWENDPNRVFNLATLASTISSSSSGNYAGCSYTTSGSLVSLKCSWR